MTDSEHRDSRDHSERRGRPGSRNQGPDRRFGRSSSGGPGGAGGRQNRDGRDRSRQDRGGSRDRRDGWDNRGSGRRDAPRGERRFDRDDERRGAPRGGRRDGRRWDDRGGRGGGSWQDLDRREDRRDGRRDDSARGDRRYDRRQDRRDDSVGGERPWQDRDRRDDRPAARRGDAPRGGRRDDRRDDRPGRERSWQDRDRSRDRREDRRDDRRPDRRDASRGDRRFERHDDHRGRNDRRDDRVARRDLNDPETARFVAPDIDDDVTGREIDKPTRRQLEALEARNAERVAQHLVMTARYLEADPHFALEHANAAVRKAGRVAVVREAAGVAAYAAGDFGLALKELRTHRRISGSEENLPLIVDCQRALGRAAKALEEAQSPVAEKLDAAGKVELAMVVSGIHTDAGDRQGALEALQIPQLDRNRGFSYSPRLFRAYAEALRAVGRDKEAVAWQRQATVAEAALGLGAFSEPEIVDLGDDLDDDDAARTVRAAGDRHSAPAPDAAANSEGDDALAEQAKAEPAPGAEPIWDGGPGSDRETPADGEYGSRDEGQPSCERSEDAASAPAGPESTHTSPAEEDAAGAEVGSAGTEEPELSDSTAVEDTGPEPNEEPDTHE